MKLNPVESTNVAAIGHLEDEKILIVRYRDGAVYAISGVTLPTWEALNAAESKGRFLVALQKTLPEGGIRRIGVGAPAVPSAPPAPEPIETLNVPDVDADKCCIAAVVARGRSRIFLTESVHCADCGTELAPEMAEGVRYWRIRPHFGVTR